MPTINKPKKKRIYQKQGRSKEAAKIYNTNKWKKLRKWKITVSPLCEYCLSPEKTNSSGKKEVEYTPAEEVHHIQPILSTEDPLRRKELAYDYANLVSLCKFHHHKVHKKGK